MARFEFPGPKDKKNGVARTSIRSSNRGGSAQEQERVTSMMETKHAELEERRKQTNCGMDEPRVEGITPRRHLRNNGPARNRRRRSSKSKGGCRSSKSSKNTAEGHKAEMSRVRTKEQARSRHTAKRKDNTKGFRERRQGHDDEDEEIKALIEGLTNTDKKDTKHRQNSAKGSSNVQETTKRAKRHEKVQRILEET